MKIYNIDSKKSKIQWSSRVGQLEVKGEMDAHDGSLITELGELIEGNVRVDLKTLKVTDSSLEKEKEKKFIEHLKSAPIFEGDDTLANYKIEKIIPDESTQTIKGFLTFGDLAFGMDIHAKIEQSDGQLHARGKIQASKSNFQFLEELEKIYADRLDEDKSISTFEVDCDIVASVK